MIETCIHGHVRTEQNTRWYKDTSRNRVKRRCMDCKAVARPLKGGLDALGWSVQRTDHAHEDIEDLLNFGATYAEIIERGPYAHWNSLQKSLKRRGRDDLMTALREKKELV